MKTPAKTTTPVLSENLTFILVGPFYLFKNPGHMFKRSPILVHVHFDAQPTLTN
jgi:hypothetical protein